MLGQRAGFAVTPSDESCRSASASDMSLGSQSGPPTRSMWQCR